MTKEQFNDHFTKEYFLYFKKVKDYTSNCSFVEDILQELYKVVATRCHTIDKRYVGWVTNRELKRICCLYNPNIPAQNLHQLILDDMEMEDVLDQLLRIHRKQIDNSQIDDLDFEIDTKLFFNRLTPVEQFTLQTRLDGYKMYEICDMLADEFPDIYKRPVPSKALNKIQKSIADKWKDFYK